MVNIIPIIFAVVAIVAGLAFFSIIIDFVNSAQGDPNISSTTSTLVGLVPVFFLIGLVVIIISLVLGPVLGKKDFFGES